MSCVPGPSAHRHHLDDSRASAWNRSLILFYRNVLFVKEYLVIGVRLRPADYRDIVRSSTQPGDVRRSADAGHANRYYPFPSIEPEYRSLWNLPVGTRRPCLPHGTEARGRSLDGTFRKPMPGT